MSFGGRAGRPCTHTHTHAVREPQAGDKVSHGNAVRASAESESRTHDSPTLALSLSPEILGTLKNRQEAGIPPVQVRRIDLELVSRFSLCPLDSTGGKCSFKKTALRCSSGWASGSNAELRRRARTFGLGDLGLNTSALSVCLFAPWPPTRHSAPLIAMRKSGASCRGPGAPPLYRARPVRPSARSASPDRNPRTINLDACQSTPMGSVRRSRCGTRALLSAREKRAVCRSPGSRVSPAPRPTDLLRPVRDSARNERAARLCIRVRTVGPVS